MERKRARARGSGNEKEGEERRVISASGAFEIEGKRSEA